MELEPVLRALTAAVLTWVGLLLSLGMVTWEEEKVVESLSCLGPLGGSVSTLSDTL